MRNHWSGSFTPNISGPSEAAKAIVAEAENAGREAEDAERARGDDENRVKAAAKGAKLHPGLRQSSEQLMKGHSKKELYNIADSDWGLIDKGLEQLVFPAAFGDRSRGTSILRKAGE